MPLDMPRAVTGHAGAFSDLICNSAAMALASHHDNTMIIAHL
jgi:hypothetical protein